MILINLGLTGFGPNEVSMNGINVVMKKSGRGAPENSPYSKFGAKINPELKIKEYSEKHGISFKPRNDLKHDSQDARSFFSMCFSLFSFLEQRFLNHNESGGFNLPHPFLRIKKPGRQVRPNQTDKKCSLISFESACLELTQDQNDFFEHLYYGLILPDLLNTADDVTGDSVIVAQRGPWEPPHAHIVNFENPKNDVTVSYGVNINALAEPKLVFDFFSGNFMPFFGEKNYITKILFHGTHLHQTIKQSYTDKNTYFFFIFDGVQLKDQSLTAELENNVMFERWFS